MSAPSLLTRLSDRLYLAFNSGIRVRIWNDPQSGFQMSVLGNREALRSHADKLTVALNDLQPAGEGTVDARMDGSRCAIKVSGSIGEDNLEQRLRNILLARV